MELETAFPPANHHDSPRPPQLDPGAFVQVFEDHFDSIYRYLARRVGTDLAEELAAETFVVAFDHRADYDATRGGVRPWLLGIATNLMRRRRRRERAELRAYSRAGVDGATEPHAGLPARLDAAAARPRLARALSRLSEGHRDVLLLWAFGELGYDEIAHALAIPVGTVRSRLHRARTEMRAALNHDGKEPPNDRP